MNFFNDNYDYLINLLSDLVKQDTTNPPGNEYLCAEFVRKEFESLNIPYKTFEKEQGRTNIIGEIGKGKKSIMIAAHLDVVPAGDGWNTNPFEATIKGDRIFGRGVLDDKGLMASLLLLAKYLKTIEDKLDVKIIIAGVADEEKGSEFGITYLVENNLINPDYAIIPDNAGNLKEINIAEKGHAVIKAKSFGIQAHAMNPQKGVNAITHLSRFLLEVEKYEFKYENHIILDAPTLNIGTIKGGTVFNSVPNNAEAQIDIRYLPSQTIESIFNDFNEIILNLKKHNPTLNIELELSSDAKSISVSKDNILVKTIKEEAEKFHGQPVIITGMGGGTVCKDLVKHNCISVCYSAGDNEFYHMVNENILIKELIDYAAIMANVVLKLNEQVMFL